MAFDRGDSQIGVSSTDAITVDNSNNVGIGIETPSAKLDVNGNARIRGELSVGEVGSTGPLEIESPNDILLKPTGTVNTNGKRISGIGVASGQNDALSAAAMTTGIINGVKLTNTVSADTNVLDWYEEGTFTPSVRGATTAGTATYPGLRVGQYTRIGNQCRVRARVQYSVTGSSGPIVITGLPYSSGNLSGGIALGIGSGFVSSFTFTGQLQFYVINSFLYPITFSSAGSPSNPVDTEGELDIDITYFIS